MTAPVYGSPENVAPNGRPGRGYRGALVDGAMIGVVSVQLGHLMWLAISGAYLYGALVDKAFVVGLAVALMWRGRTIDRLHHDVDVLRDQLDAQPYELRMVLTPEQAAQMKRAHPRPGDTR